MLAQDDTGVGVVSVTDEHNAWYERCHPERSEGPMDLCQRLLN
jgi:hypothetical protein